MGESHKISSLLRQFSTISCTIIAAVVEQIVESGDTDFVQKSYNCLLSFLFMYMYVCIKIIVVFLDSPCTAVERACCKLD